MGRVVAKGKLRRRWPDSFPRDRLHGYFDAAGGPDPAPWHRCHCGSIRILSDEALLDALGFPPVSDPGGCLPWGDQVAG